MSEPGNAAGRTPWQGGWMPAVTLLAGLVLILPARAQTPSPAAEGAVESGRRALANRGSYPWYDAQQDALRRLDVRPPRPTAANRNSTWESQAAPPASSASWRWLWELLRWFVWAVIVALLVGLIWLLVRAFLNREARAEGGTEASETSATRDYADLIENLPFPLPRQQADFLDEARRLYEAGRFAEAMIYLFSYQLVALDQHHVIRLARGKTNRQYLRELEPRADLRDILVRTMLAFEDAFFGHYELDRACFENCWTRLDDFHRRIEEAGT
jgi:hypothetical protein